MISKLFKKKISSPVCEPITKNKSVFFVHIPKTAGTSFRKALETVQPVKADYGAQSIDTSSLIHQYIYKEVNPYQLKQEMLLKPFSLTGHVTIHKYADFFNLRDIITFVREPIEQIVSHYNHYVTHHNCKDYFENFYRKAQFVNCQRKVLNDVPLSLIGYVGITEAYNDSLTIINKGLNTNIGQLKQNIRQHAHKESSHLSAEVIKELLTLNQQDVQLYQKALSLHQERMAMLEQGREWTHVFTNINPNNVLHGCAYFADNDEAVDIEVWVNGKKEQNLSATGFFGGFPKFCFPRERYVGFHVPLNKWLSSDIDILELVVKKTGQRHKVDLPEKLKNKV